MKFGNKQLWIFAFVDSFDSYLNRCSNRLTQSAVYADHSVILISSVQIFLEMKIAHIMFSKTTQWIDWIFQTRTWQRIFLVLSRQTIWSSQWLIRSLVRKSKNELKKDAFRTWTMTLDEQELIKWNFQDFLLKKRKCLKKIKKTD